MKGIQFHDVLRVFFTRCVLPCCAMLVVACGSGQASSDKQQCDTDQQCPAGYHCVDHLCLQSVDEDSSGANDRDVILPDSAADADSGLVDVNGDDIDGADIDEMPDSDGLSDEKDSDGDSIPDSVEGDGDADGDGTPNYLDTDSDGDAIPDSVEAPKGIPVDTDSDGTPDYLDTDSDGDTVPDGVEGTDDVDSDGAPNYRDEDADGDNISDTVEAGNTPDKPVDSDGDGTPDYLDTDSDDDTISDRFEGVRDNDGDTIPNYLDTDSDNDTIPDITEKGSSDAPLDTDNDSLFDFEDADSDNDGLADRDEQMCSNLGKDSRLFNDVDGDGFSDLAEQAVGSDMCDPNKGVTDVPGINFYFELPYQKPEKTDVLTFSPQVSTADVWFNIDTTGSMRKKIENLKYTLSATIIPGVRNRISNAFFALSQFKDEDEVPLIQAEPTGNFPIVQNAVNSLRAGSGNDCPEAGVWSLFEIIDTGEWRKDSLPIVIHITDAPYHERGGHSEADMFTALSNKSVRVITILAAGGCDSPTAQTQLNNLSLTSGAVVPACAEAGRTVLKYEVDEDGSGLDSAIINGIDALIKYTVFDIYAESADDGKTSTPDTSRFIKRVEALNYIAPSEEPEHSCAPTATPATFNGASYHNGFQNFSTATSSSAKPGSKLTFTVVAQNDFYKPEEHAKVFTARINILDAKTHTVLDTQNVTIIVPPVIHGGGES